MTQKVQLEVVVRLDACAWAPPSRPGDVIWVDQEQARHLIEAGLCRYAGEALGRTSLPGYGKEAVNSGRAFPLRVSDGWPIDRFAVVERTWEGATVACIGGGPSLSEKQVKLVASARLPCIAINDSYRIAPFADISYFADLHWWQWHKDRDDFKAFAGQKCSINGYGTLIPDPSVYMLHNHGHLGLSEKNNGICTGMNSGFQSINIAFLAGAKRILLLGYDMKFRGDKTHWHDGHPVKTGENNYAVYAKKFASMLPQLEAHGVEVINCTPDSALHAFPRGELESYLPDTRAALV